MKNENLKSNNGEEIKANISKTNSVHIKAISQEDQLNSSVFAVNWFNTRWLWLYNFYNLLAGISVHKIGGKAFFKGTVKHNLYGIAKDKRDVLLIVNYPSLVNFKKLVENRFFQIVSLLRVLSVKKFTFGFSHKTSSNESTKRNDFKNKSFVIHHYKANEDITKKLQTLLTTYSVTIFYSGRISSLLYSGDGNRATKQIPCIMDGIVILEADDFSQIKNAVSSDDYQSLLKTTESSYIASLDRML